MPFIQNEHRIVNRFRDLCGSDPLVTGAGALVDPFSFCSNVVDLAVLMFL